MTGRREQQPAFERQLESGFQVGDVGAVELGVFDALRASREVGRLGLQELLLVRVDIHAAALAAA